MNKRPRQTGKNGSSDASLMELNYGSPQRHLNNSPQGYYDEEQDANIAYQMHKQEVKRAKKEGLDHLYKQDYQPANFNKAVQYRNSRSYMKKLPSGHYKELGTFEDTQNLKEFGLGPYFFIEFFRRMTWLFFIMMLVQGLTIYINWLGSGMDAYASSFSTYLIKATLGNYSENRLTAYDGYIVTIAPAVNYLALLLFYWIWKGHYHKTIADAEEDNTEVQPQKFCLQIVGLEESYINDQELKTFFSSFGPVYEISLVRRYKNKLSYFEQLDELQQQIKEEELQLVLNDGDGDKKYLQQLKKQKEKLSKYINTLQIYPKTISAFVHFQYQKSKIDCLSYFNDHYLFDTCGHNCMRSTCCCCIEEPSEKYLFNGEKLFIKSEKVPTPADIQWQNYELSPCSKFCRGLFAFIIIVIFLAISCSIIGLCSIYIGSHSGDCEGVVVPGSASQINSTTTSDQKRCFCDANLFQSFSDAEIQSVCLPFRSEILTSQGIQYGVIATSAITNFIFGVVVGKLVDCVRPATKSSGMLVKTTIYTIFLIFNSIMVPVLIYADIYGFAASEYVSFLTVISADIKNFFAFDNLSFYPDFNSTWYRNVSSIFPNFLVVDIIITWLFLIIDKCIAGYEGLKDDEGKILQKHMNQKITSYKLNVYKEVSYMYLVIFMCSMFWAGVPSLLPLGFFSIFSRYVVCRMLLQSNSTKIVGLGEQFMSLSIMLLPWILILFPLIGCWMLVGNSSIYPNNLSMGISLFDREFEELDKQLYLPFYIIISLVAFIEFFFWNTIVRCGTWLCSLCYEKKETVRPQHTRPFVDYAKGMNILCSYNIRNNDQMRNVIINLEKYLVDKEMD